MPGPGSPELPRSMGFQQFIERLREGRHRVIFTPDVITGLGDEILDVRTGELVGYKASGDSISLDKRTLPLPRGPYRVTFHAPSGRIAYPDASGKTVMGQSYPYTITIVTNQNNLAARFGWLDNPFN